MIKLKCPGCKKQLEIDEKHIDVKGNCNNCGVQLIPRNILQNKCDNFIKKNFKYYLLACLCVEFLFLIPFISWFIVINTICLVCIIPFIMHLIGLDKSHKQNILSIGNIIGVFAALFSFIPILGWGLHLLSAIYLFITIEKIKA